MLAWASAQCPRLTKIVAVVGHRPAQCTMSFLGSDSHSVGLMLLSSLIQRVGGTILSSMSGKFFPTKIEDEQLFFSIDG